MKVWKYPIPFAGSVTHRIPIGAKPLHMAFQDNTPMLWMAVDPDADQAYRDIYCIDTGGLDIPFGSDYLGTIVGPHTTWHYFWYPNKGVDK